MVDALGKGVGVELTYRGQGHGAYDSENKCVQAGGERLSAGREGAGSRDRLLLAGRAVRCAGRATQARHRHPDSNDILDSDPPTTAMIPSATMRSQGGTGRWSARGPLWPPLHCWSRAVAAVGCGDRRQGQRRARRPTAATAPAAPPGRRRPALRADRRRDSTGGAARRRPPQDTHRAGQRLAVRDAQGAAGLVEAGRRDDRARADPHQGRGADNRIGSLLFNFGGPGGSGVSMMPRTPPATPQLRERYDLVSWDPRGVARSEGVRCRERQGDPGRRVGGLHPGHRRRGEGIPAGRHRLRRGLREGRRQADGARLDHRHRPRHGPDAPGPRRREAHYFGISYGTELGGVYAHLFPQNVGRLGPGRGGRPDRRHGGPRAEPGPRLPARAGQLPQSPPARTRAGHAEDADLLERIDAKPLPTASAAAS